MRCSTVFNFKFFMYMIAIIFCCFRPKIELFDFAAKLSNKNYDIYVAVNDYQYEIPYYDRNKINIIRINNDECKQNNYYNSNNDMYLKTCSRDNAFYYFNRISNKEYEYYWFIEEDVFIPSITTIQNIDLKYTSGDYLSNGYNIILNYNHLPLFNTEDNKNILTKFNKEYMFFESGVFKNERLDMSQYFELPWFKGMICAFRATKKFLDLIDSFAIMHSKLIFDEILFPTLCYHNKLKMICIKELETIVYRTDFSSEHKNYYFKWDYIDIDNFHLYHPIKDITLHEKLRIDN